MKRPKSREVREKELQDLLATPEGRRELQELCARYEVASGRPKPPRTSVVTYVIVHERAHGLVNG
jgi:hypothetical protein